MLLWKYPRLIRRSTERRVCRLSLDSYLFVTELMMMAGTRTFRDFKEAGGKWCFVVVDVLHGNIELSSNYWSFY